MDPFTDAYQVAPGCFNLSGSFKPASIRDQMLRSFLLIRHLFSTGYLTPGCRILIVGAGAAGVTAGMVAARNQAKVLIIEKGTRPFATQRRVSSRWIDLTIHDWPLPHFRETRFPFRPDPAMPLTTTKVIPANRLVARWTQALENARGASLDVKYSTTFERIIRDGPGYTDDPVCAVISDADRSGPQGFDAVFFCHGFGPERTAISEFTGVPFWDNRQKWPLPGEWVGSPALIIGGGDGALQDFILLATGKNSVRELFSALFPDSLGAVTEREVHAFEDQGNRAYLWSGSTNGDHSVGVFEEEAMRVIVERVLKSHHVEANLARLIGANPHRIVIAHRCTHFSASYALNRFLALLIIEVLSRRGFHPRKACHEVIDIDSSDELHKCDKNNRESCYGYSHDVLFQPSDCFSTLAGPPESLHFERLIVRLGVDPPAAVKGLGEGWSIGRRQSLPFFPL